MSWVTFMLLGKIKPWEEYLRKNAPSEDIPQSPWTKVAVTKMEPQSRQILGNDGVLLSKRYFNVEGTDSED